MGKEHLGIVQFSGSKYYIRLKPLLSDPNAQNRAEKGKVSLKTNNHYDQEDSIPPIILFHNNPQSTTYISFNFKINYLFYLTISNPQLEPINSIYPSNPRGTVIGAGMHCAGRGDQKKKKKGR